MRFLEVLKAKLLLKEETEEEKKRKEVKLMLKEMKKAARKEKKMFKEAHKKLEKGPKEEDLRRFEQWIEQMKMLKHEEILKSRDIKDELEIKID